MQPSTSFIAAQSVLHQHHSPPESEGMHIGGEGEAGRAWSRVSVSMLAAASGQTMSPTAETHDTISTLYLRRLMRLRVSACPARAPGIAGGGGHALLLEPLLSDGAGGDAADGLSRGGAPAAGRGAEAVLHLVGEVRVRRARDLRHFAVVVRAHVLVAHKHADRRTERDALLRAYTRAYVRTRCTTSRPSCWRFAVR